MRDLPIHVMNPATGGDRPFATARHPSVPASWGTEALFTASPDGRIFIYSAYVARGSDLMLIENFR
jgi:hypothetical protein